MKRNIFFVCLFASLPGIISPQDVRINAAFDTSRIFLGDQVKYIITLEKPGNLSINMPVFKDTLLKQVEILKGPVIDSSLSRSGLVTIKHEYLVTSFDSGFYQIPPAYAEIRTGTGIKRFYSDYAWLEVMRVRISPPDTTAGIFDIEDPYKIPLTPQEVIPWILVAILAGCLIWLLIRISKRLRKQKTGGFPGRPSEPPHIIAFRDLEKLKTLKLWQKGETKEYYSLLTEIIRQYLFNRYSLQAMEMTSPETLQAIKESGALNADQYRELRTILTGGDLVKFAKYHPEPSENELHYEYAWNFVKSTMIVPETTEKDPDGKVNEEEKK